MATKVKTGKQLYVNGVEAFGGAVLTVGDLKRMLTRGKVPDSTPLVLSSDEEGNRFGTVLSIVYEPNEQTFEGLGTFTTCDDVPASAQIVVLTPAL